VKADSGAARSCCLPLAYPTYLTHPTYLVRRTLHHRVGFDQEAQRTRQVGAGGHEDREVIEAGSATDAGRGLASGEDQQIGTAGTEPGGPMVPSMNGEPQVRFVEPYRSAQVPNREVDRAARRAGINQGSINQALFRRRGLWGLRQQALDLRRHLLLRFGVELSARLAGESGMRAADPPVSPE
jgi:hypothetical protein